MGVAETQHVLCKQKPRKRKKSANRLMSLKAFAEKSQITPVACLNIEAISFIYFM